MKTVATIEARMTSSRLPGKVLMPAGGKPLLQILIERLGRVPELDEIVLATTINQTDDPVAALGQKLGVTVFRGSEDDVLERVCGALRQSAADICVEITGDCPLIDPAIVSHALAEYLKTRATHAYISNGHPETGVPPGLNAQVFSAQDLFSLSAEASDPLDREHVSYGFYRPESGGRWNPRFITSPGCEGASRLLVTLDYQEDYLQIKRLHEELSAMGDDYSAEMIISWLRAHPEMQEACWNVRRKPKA